MRSIVLKFEVLHVCIAFHIDLTECVDTNETIGLHDRFEAGPIKGQRCGLGVIT